jgi:hypothetical protein
VGAQDPKYKNRLIIENGSFTARFVRNGIPAKGDPGSGGALRVQERTDYFYVKGLGVIASKKPASEFKAGISSCTSQVSEHAGVVTDCAYPDGSQSSFAVFDAEGGLLEFLGPCAGGGMCKYRRIKGQGIIR